MPRQSRHSRQQNSVARRRKLRLESLERRQLLAADLLFADSFESGSNSNDWAGNWVEDSQNDWFRSTQRATDGSYSAEIDGGASNAALTLASPLDLTDYGSAELSFSWFIERNWDSGEYIAVDVYDGGWQEVARLRGNVDPENTWQHQTIPLDNYLNEDFRIRFRSTVSARHEDGNVDDVRIEGTLANTEPVGLVSHWRADNNALDAVGNNHGTPVSGTAYANGQMGQAFSFDGVNDRVLVPDSLSLRLTKSMTIESWIRADSIPAPGQQGEIFFRGDDRAGLDPYSLSIQPDGRLRYEVASLSDAASVWASMPIGEFVHVVATLDDASGSMRLFFNGVLVSQATTTVRPFGNLDPVSNPGIGIGNHGGYPETPHNFPFHGLIDELKLYDVALSEAEVLANFTAAQGDLLPGVSISDATAIEGDPSLGVLGNFVSEGSGGLARPRLSTFGPDRNGDGTQDFYIASADTNQILVYDGSSGASLGPFVTGVSQLDSPVDLQFSLNDEHLYVSSNTGNAVHRFDGATGDYIDTPVSGLANPLGLSLDANGDLLIANRDTDEILRYDGQGVTTLIPAGSGGLDMPREALVGPDGKLYVASRATVQVLRYDLASGTSEVFASPALASLSWIAFSPDGSKLYATGRDTDVCCDTSLVTIDAATGEVTDTLRLDRDGWSFSVGPDGTIYSSGNGFGNYVDLIGPSPQAEFTVSLSQPWPVPVTVDFATSDVTAIAGSDYVATSGTLVFEPGVTSRRIVVPTLDDTIPESSETFEVSLLSAVGANVADAQGLGTIADDDQTQPLAADDAYVVSEDAILSIAALGVLANDSDAESDPLTATLVATPEHGTLSLNADGSFEYIPNADYHGTDSFTYRAHDGISESNLATVNISVNPVNDAPVATPDSYSADQDAVLSIIANGVLNNDGDVDGDTLSAVPWSGTSAQGGAVVLNSNGSFTYTPPAGFTGTDSFSYLASDGSLTSNLTTVSIDVAANDIDAMYVYDIRFESRYWGWQRRAVFEIRWDSNGDGQGGSADARRSGVAITVEFAGQSYSGTTDSNGLFRTNWTWNPGSGTHAEVVDLALADYAWDPLALDLEDDSDGDGLPDAQL